MQRAAWGGDRVKRPIGREEPAAPDVPALGPSECVETRDERLAALPEEEARAVVKRVGERPHRVPVIRQKVRDHHCLISFADGLAAQWTELPPAEVYGEEG
jgi:hypothetical protein